MILYNNSGRGTMVYIILYTVTSYDMSLTYIKDHKKGL